MKIKLFIPGPLCAAVMKFKTVRGTFHQGILGKYAGHQCTVIALFALAVAFLQPMSLWQTADVNNALLFGNDLYTHFIDNQIPIMSHTMNLLSCKL